MLVGRVVAARRRLHPIAAMAHAIVHGGTRTLSAAAVVWRPHLAVSALGGAAVLAALDRRWPAAVLAGVGVLAGGRAAGRLLPRPAVAAGGTDLVILSANVQHGRADTGDLAGVIARESPDVVVLPEAGTDFRDKLMPLLAGLGYRSWVSTAPGVADGPSVVLLVAGRAGDVQVRVGAGMRMPHLEATGGILGERRLYALHTTAPTGRGRTAWWLAELELIGRWTRDRVAPIVAGDLNATLDHAPLRAALGGCRSAVTGTRRALVGTYPAALPRWLGIHIDHVLVPAGARTTRFGVIDLARTDHRAVLAAVRLVGVDREVAG